MQCQCPAEQTPNTFALLYPFLPDRELKWGHVIVGALVTTVLFSIGKQVIGLSLGQSTTSSTYGAAGSIVVLLLWVYYSSQVVLLGAEFTRVYTELRPIKELRAFLRFESQAVFPPSVRTLSLESNANPTVDVAAFEQRPRIVGPAAIDGVPPASVTSGCSARDRPDWKLTYNLT